MNVYQPEEPKPLPGCWFLMMGFAVGFWVGLVLGAFLF